jgi:hypothetical protein
MKRLLLSALCAVPAFCIGQTLLYNDGAMIKVQAGATLYVEGGIQNTATGTIDNDGIIEVKGNFINAGTWEPSQANTLKFTGNVNSDVTSGSAVFQTVVVQKDATFNVNLIDTMTIDTLLNFNATGANRIITNNFKLKLGSAATVTGYDADEYVATTGGTTGMVQKVVTANGTFEFPIGDITNYSPISSTYTGSAYASANIRAKANDLTHPDKPTDATDYISRYWDVNQTGITDYSNTLTGTYIPADVVGTAALVKGAVYDGAAWKYAGAAAGANIAIGSTSEETADFTGTNFFGKTNLVVLLQGATNTTTGVMTTTYTSNATIEALMLTSPYVDAPASVTDVPTGVTDWVKLELRDPASPATVLGKASVFVKSDGSIVGLDGTSLPIIKNGNPTSIVAVVHRTHLSIRTPNAGIDVVDPTLYNFSLDTLNAYRNPAFPGNANMKFLATPSKYVMWASNGNSNTNVRFSGPANDRDYLLNTILSGNPTTIISNTYSVGDFNMNGTVRFSGPANDRDFLLNTVLVGNPTKIINQHF